MPADFFYCSITNSIRRLRCQTMERVFQKNEKSIPTFWWNIDFYITLWWKISVTKFRKSKIWDDSFKEFSVGYVMVCSILSVDIVFMEKFAKQNGHFLTLWKQNETILVTFEQFRAISYFRALEGWKFLNMMSYMSTAKIKSLKNIITSIKKRWDLKCSRITSAYFV